MTLKACFVMLLILWLGLEFGYRIGRQDEARTHKTYIENLNLKQGR